MVVWFTVFGVYLRSSTRYDVQYMCVRVLLPVFEFVVNLADHMKMKCCTIPSWFVCVGCSGGGGGVADLRVVL